MGRRKTRQSSDLDLTAVTELTPSTQARMSPKPIPAPTYDGTTDVEEFLGQFEAIAQHNGWSPEECKLRLKLALKGTVGQGVNAVSYKEMCRQLQTQYAPSIDMATALLKSVKRQNSENIYQFTERVRKLIVIALPDLTEKQREQQVKREVITSVSPGSQLAWTLKLAPPATIEETVEIIHKFNEFSGGHCKVNRVESEELLELRKEIEKQSATQKASQEEMFKQFASLQATMMEQMLTAQKQMAATQQEAMAQLMAANTSGQRDAVRCYNCNGRGHYSKECKKPKRVSGNDGVQSS